MSESGNELEGVEKSQTQQEMNTLLTDIFGGDSDSDADININRKKDVVKDIGDDIFDDSDNELAPSSKRDRLKKGPSTVAKTTSNAVYDDDSDFESHGKKENPTILRKISKKDRKKKLEKNRKNKRQDDADHIRRSKRAKHSGAAGTDNVLSGEGDGHVSSGGEYDSGEELPVTAEDINFIADDDENADIMREYDEDNQDFDDDEPGEYAAGAKKKKKSSSSANSNAESTRRMSNANSDPLSQTLAEMKNPKVKAMSDSDKERIVEKLLLKMSRAAELDDIAYQQQQPATHKLNLLPTVQQFVGMKPLQQTLLDRDILNHLRDWIEPRDSTSLPSLSIRTAVYNILLQLPCMSDHLRRTVRDRPPIGVTIVTLRKHKMETPENKRILKELMEKWSRPIFGQSTSFSGSSSSLEHHADSLEIQQALSQRYESSVATTGAAVAGGASVSKNSVAASASSSSSSSRGGIAAADHRLDDVLTGKNKADGASAEDARNRVRTPYSNGFLFTVQPALKNVNKGDIQEKVLGEERMKLVKVMSQHRTTAETGKKVNPRYLAINHAAHKMCILIFFKLSLVFLVVERWI
jgi:transcription factor SPN1